MLGVSARFVMAGLVFGVALTAATLGCDQTCEEQGGFPVKDEAGEEVCEAKCEPDLCVEGNTCVGNRCRLVCDAHTDCFQMAKGDDLTQACIEVIADSETGLNDGAKIAVCETSPKAAAIGISCSGNDACAAHSACPDGTDCALGGCAPEACKPLSCRTSGEEEQDGYCTTFDCRADSDCAPGMYCSAVRVEGTATDCAGPSGAADKGKGEP